MYHWMYLYTYMYHISIEICCFGRAFQLMGIEGVSTTSIA